MPGHFAFNFGRLLALHGCTQQRAAELLGVSRTTIANWVGGTKEPNLSSLMKLAGVFEIDPVRFAQVPFVELLEDLLDVPRFIRVEAKVFGGEVIPLDLKAETQ
jgi:transcriptional regulator with XRE-family HTH domain